MRLEDWYEASRRRPRVADSLLLGPLWAFTILTTANQGWPLAAIGTVQALALIARRTRPRLAYTAVCLGCAVQLVAFPHPGVNDVFFLVAHYSLAAYEPRARWRLAGLVVGVAAGIVAALNWRRPDDSVLGTVVAGAFLVATAVVAWIGGDLMRNRRAVVARLAEQNDALRRERDQRAQLAAQAERARIAREMHDVVAHSLAVVVVQADGAAYAARHTGAPPQQRLDASAVALETIAGTARSALAETRRLVRVLRDEAQDLDYAPLAGLADLDALLDRVRGSGTAVSVTASPGHAAELPRDIDLAAYRVVQEGLTNVIKHAGPGAQAHVTLRRDGRALTVSVEDDGWGAAATSDTDGNGLVGMTERVTAAGGSLRTGPRPGGGFAVVAVLPTNGSAT